MTKGVALDPNSQSARMLSCLREVFRARGMRHAEIGRLLGVSEKSVMRYMAGRGVTLSVLERMCATVGVTVGELAGLAGYGDEAEIPTMSDDQEAVLAAEPRLAIVLALLSIGWTSGRLQREGLVGPSDLNAILTRLDRLGLITLYPHNRTRMRVRFRPIDAASEPMRRVVAEAGARVLAGLDFADPDAVWRFSYARLGPASAARVAKRLDAFLAEVAELGRQDMDLGGEQVKWYAVCGLLVEHDVLGLRLLRDEPSVS